MISILQTRTGDTASLMQRTGLLLIATMTMLLGAISIITGDFAYTWQPVAESVPARALLARITGVVLIVASASLLVPRTARQGIVAMTWIFTAWLFVLHLPQLLAGAGWLGFFEFLLPFGAFLALLGMTSARAPVHAWQQWLTGERAMLLGRLCFGVGLIGCGASHFVYAEGAAQMIPEWIPGRLFFTYLTGVGHVAAGVSLLAGVLMRLSTALLCFMLACFVLLLHVPRVIANPSSRYEWTMLIVSVLFNGTAWLIAAAVRSRSAMHSMDARVQSSETAIAT